MGKNGDRCKGWRVKGESLCAGHLGLGVSANPRESASLSAEVRKERREAREGRDHADGGARRGRRPQEAIRERLEQDPEAVADYVMAAIKAGKDIRALTSILDRVYSDEAGPVDEPHTFDELAKLNRDERRLLMRQLEAAGRSKPFNAAAYREALRCRHCGGAALG
jgi:hypothetical protein